jgi:hypothetical protein
VRLPRTAQVLQKQGQDAQQHRTSCERDSSDVFDLRCRNWRRRRHSSQIGKRFGRHMPTIHVVVTATQFGRQTPQYRRLLPRFLSPHASAHQRIADGQDLDLPNRTRHLRDAIEVDRVSVSAEKHRRAARRPVFRKFTGDLQARQQLSLARLLDRSIRLSGMVPACLLAIALLLLARPLIEGPPSYPTQVTNIQIALDTSGSMNEPFGSRIREDGNSFTRFDAAMDVINQFTRNRQGDAFGLSIFTAKVIHWVPLTTDLSAIRLATPFCPPWSVSAGVVGPNAGWQRDCVLLRTAESAERR